MVRWEPYIASRLSFSKARTGYCCSFCRRAIPAQSSIVRRGSDPFHPECLVKKLREKIDEYEQMIISIRLISEKDKEILRLKEQI